MSTSNREPVEIIAVAVTSHQLRRDPYGTLDDIFDALPRPTSLSIVALPPLWPVYAAINGRSLDKAAHAVWEHDPVRVASTWFSYSGFTHRRAFPWLVTHPVQQEFLQRVQRASDATGYHILGPTSWMGQPHPHWERWPQSARVFHDAWGFAPGGVPMRRRQRSLALWMRRRGVCSMRDGDEGSIRIPDRGDHREAHVVAVAWDGVEGRSPSDGVMWWPRVGRPGTRPLMDGLRPNGSWRIAMVSGLDGPAAIAVRDPCRGHVCLKAVTPPLEPEGGFDGGAVRFARWRGQLGLGI